MTVYDQQSVLTKRRRDAINKMLVKHLKVGSITIVLGICSLVLLIFARILLKRFIEDYVWEILISIPVTIICLGGFTVFYEWFIRDDFTEAMRSLHSAWDTGVIIFPTHDKAPKRIEVLEGARKQVKLMSTTFFRYFGEVGEEIIQKKIAEQNVKFKFIIYHPESPALKERGRQEDINPKFFTTEIEGICERYLGPLVIKYPNNVEVRFCQFNTAFGITIIDDVEMVLSLNIPGKSRSRNQTPCLIIKNKYERNSIFKQYDDSFDDTFNILDRGYPNTIKKFFIKDMPVSRHESGATSA
jgi:hypothetical protein